MNFCTQRMQLRIKIYARQNLEKKIFRKSRKRVEHHEILVAAKVGRRRSRTADFPSRGVEMIDRTYNI